MSEDKIQEIIEVINELCDDITIPKNIKLKFQEIISYLKAEGETSIKVNKAYIWVFLTGQCMVHAKGSMTLRAS